MNQRRRWPAELRAAIDAADAEGIPANRILKLAKSGELDGLTQRYNIPQSTFFDILAKVRQARISSIEPVKPGEEEAAAGAILRRALEIAKREIAKVDAQLSDPRKSASERATLARTLDTFNRMVRGYENKAANAHRSKNNKTDSATAKGKDTRANPLASLIADQERKLREKPAPPSTHQASTSVSPPSTESTMAETQDTEAGQNVNGNGHADRLSTTRADDPVAA